jgi:hypothetical protein
MAWIEVHQSLATHRKTFELADQLNISPVQAAGHLVFFWLWALDNAPNGALDGITPRMIARSASWNRSVDQFVSSMIVAGFIDEVDGVLSIHNWEDYTGRLIQRREYDRLRMRDRRATMREQTENSSRTVPAPTTGRPQAPNPTQQYPTQPVEEREVWPEWYHTLFAIPGFTHPLDACLAWLRKNEVPEDLAITTALALLSKWPGSNSRPYRDAWATFQTWIRRARNNGAGQGRAVPASGSPATEAAAARSMARLEIEQEKQREREAADEQPTT